MTKKKHARVESENKWNYSTYKFHHTLTLIYNKDKLQEEQRVSLQILVLVSHILDVVFVPLDT